MEVFDGEHFKVLCEAFGEYQTNCYLAINKHKQEALIIDPGIGATAWILQTLTNDNLKPLAILNTHGHFDHIWSNAELSEHFHDIPLLCPYEDAFMLEEDCFELGLPLSTPSILVGAKAGDKVCKNTSNTSNLGRENDFQYGDFQITFICYPGHTPGCSVILLSHVKNTAQQIMFSGDFIFKRSIGRSDFPYSSHQAMKASLEEFPDTDLLRIF